MVWSDTISVMKMQADKLKTFATSPLSETKQHIAALFSLSVESVDVMNKLVDARLRTGGAEPELKLDYGFMQVRKIEDFNCHTWEIHYRNESKFSFIKVYNKQLKIFTLKFSNRTIKK